MKAPSENAVIAASASARLLTRSHFALAVSYIAAYVLLDWASYVHPFATSGITPWNPQTGLSFALILLFGLEFLPWLCVAPLLAELFVRGSTLPFGAAALIAMTIGVGYGAATMILQSRRFSFDPALGSLRSLFSLVAVALLSIAVVSVSHALILVAFGALQTADLLPATLRAFIGDVIGVAVVTPFLLIFFTRRRWPPFGLEAATILILILSTIAAVFGIAEAHQLQMFYLLFIPIIWAAVRFGLEGLTTALVVTQIGLIVAIQLSHHNALDVTSYQALMVVLAVTGLAIGVLVDDQRRAALRLRLQAEALSRASRLSSMGEFAALVAHEINQPLTAIANYVRLAKQAAEQRPPDTSTAVEVSNRAIEQTERAAEVVRRLREFIGQGRSEAALITADRLIGDTLSFCRPMLERHSVEATTAIDKNVSPMRVDPLQVEQVLANLILNSIEALAEAGRRDGKILVEVRPLERDEIEFSVKDNGPGFFLELANEAPTPFATTKADGLGLGLTLARSIVEAHGGKLKIESSPRGATVTFTLKNSASGMPT
jgi:two-component system sensor kinase FixL